MSINSTNSPRIRPGIFVPPSGALSPIHVHEDEIVETLERFWDDVGPCFGYLKPDGWRIQVHKVSDQINLFARTGIDWTQTLTRPARAIAAIIRDEQAILDIELVGLTQQGLHQRDPRGAFKFQYYVLDALYLGGTDLSAVPVDRRTRIIRERLGKIAQKEFVLSNYIRLNTSGELINLYNKFLAQRHAGFDGVIVKHLDTPYFADAYKLKSEITIDLVIVGAYAKDLKDKGVDASSKEREERDHPEVKSLLLAFFDTDFNRWVPTTAITRKETPWLDVWEACRPHVQEYCTFNLYPPPKNPDIWIAPNIVLEVKVREIREGAKGAYILHAEAPRDAFLRADKDPTLCTTLQQAYEFAGINPKPSQLGLF